MNSFFGLLFTLIIGLVILIGTVVVKLTKNNDKFVHFSISMALGVIASLVMLELLPESIELLFETYNREITIVMVFGFSVLGLLLLMTLENFIPHHGHGHGEELFHLGIVSSIAIIFHNLIEGMAIYATVTNSVSMGILMGIGVGLHNIPMGMLIVSALIKARVGFLKKVVILLPISISTFAGGVIMYFNSEILTNTTLLGIILSITQGMLVYIAVFELLPHIRHCNDKKSNIIGIILGILIMATSLIL